MSGSPKWELGLGIYSASVKNIYQESSWWWKQVGAESRQYYPRLWTDCTENVEAWTSDNPMGIHSLWQRQLYLTFCILQIFSFSYDHNCFIMPFNSLQVINV
jgi:hypothetical protein